MKVNTLTFVSGAEDYLDLHLHLLRGGEEVWLGMLQREFETAHIFSEGETFIFYPNVEADTLLCEYINVNFLGNKLLVDGKEFAIPMNTAEELAENAWARFEASLEIEVLPLLLAIVGIAGLGILALIGIVSSR